MKIHIIINKKYEFFFPKLRKFSTHERLKCERRTIILVEGIVGESIFMTLKEERVY